MAIYYLTNTSPGAPSLPSYATPGSFIAVLDFCLVATMGWTKEFSGTNTATYRAPTGNRFYLGVDDTSTTGVVRLRGFESATAPGVAAASGTNPFPSDAQLNGGMYLLRGGSSTSYNTTDWVFVSDGKLFYYHSRLYSTGFSNYGTPMLIFGDFIRYNPSDSFNSCLIAETGSNVSVFSTPFTLRILSDTGSAGVAFPRSYTGTGTSLLGNLIGDPYKVGTSTSFIVGNRGIRYPNMLTGTMDMSYVEIGESAGVRGRLPGYWYPLHVQPMTADSTFTGTGSNSGKTFKVRAADRDSSGQLFLEISDTWGT